MKKQLLHLLSAAVILLGVMVASAYAHPSSAHVHKSHVLTRATGEKMVLPLNKNAGVITIDSPKASVLRQRTSARTETVRAARAPMTAFDEEASTEGAGCVREHCACSPSTHGNPWCYTTSRGDCPNHQGLLCVWSD